MDIRGNLIISWILVLIAFISASTLNYEMGVIAIGVFGGGAGYYRNKIKDDKPSLDELLGFIPLWKWFSVVYMLALSALSLHFISELSEALTVVNPVIVMAIIFFPILVPWIRYEYLLYNKS